MDSNTIIDIDPERDIGLLKTLTMIVYVLQALACIVGLTYIAAIMVNYIKLDDVRGTWLESHFRWQMRTFWYSMAWGALGLILFLIAIGYFVLLGTAFWVLYRIIKGFIYLNDGRSMPV